MIYVSAILHARISYHSTWMHFNHSRIDNKITEGGDCTPFTWLHFRPVEFRMQLFVCVWTLTVDFAFRKLSYPESSNCESTSNGISYSRGAYSLQMKFACDGRVYAVSTAFRIEDSENVVRADKNTAYKNQAHSKWKWNVHCVKIVHMRAIVFIIYTCYEQSMYYVLYWTKHLNDW